MWTTIIGALVRGGFSFILGLIFKPKVEPSAEVKQAIEQKEAIHAVEREQTDRLARRPATADDTDKLLDTWAKDLNTRR